MTDPAGGRASLAMFAVVALALAGFGFSITPAATALDNRLLDLDWRVLRATVPAPAPDDIVIVGIDRATIEAIPAPPGLWHEQLGAALTRIAAARPRAIGFDYPLPERSYEAIHPGLDLALLRGIAAAVHNGIFVAALEIDPNTRSARRIHTPFLALLAETRLGIGLAARDDDGVTRRFSILIPTEDGGFPTLAGRLCRALSARCNDGLIDFALGPAFRKVSLRDVLAASNPESLAALFRDRIVLVGDTQAHADRLRVPLNLAGWESAARDSPAVVVHAQTLRTAMLGAAPQESSRPLAVLLTLLACLPLAIGRRRLALAAALLGMAALWVAALAVLHAGLYVPIAAPLATLAVAALLPFARRVKKLPRPVPNIQHSP
ncbi:MAG TPA: CHASE2 domain-containing protein [Usitatibacter sp.]|jgi:CHASE2 domain-containing sensor protein|nr:CHASE2 domain-containing protein [Usitatibacter sp.]